MVLSDRYGGAKRPSILKRTIIYVASFGLGSLLIAALLSLAFVSLAEGVLPAKGVTPKSGELVTTDKKPITPPKSKSKLFKPPKAGSKARPPRANESKRSVKRSL